MAHSPKLRSRARDLYVAGWTFQDIAERLGVAKSTLIRWSGEEDWPEFKAQQEQLEREALALMVDMTRAARESGDPQQAYAASVMAKIAGVSSAEEDPGPKPTDVAMALLDALMLHPDVGPVVRRHRREVLRLTMRELERFGVEAVGEGVR